MPTPSACPMCGSPKSEFRRRKSGAVVCGVCGEEVRPAGGDGVAGPAAPGRPRRGGGRARAASRTNVPGILLMVFGGLGVLLVAAGFVAQSVNPPPPVDPALPAAQREAREAGRAAGRYAGSGLLLITNLIQVLAGWKMRRLESYSSCVIGAVVACIPCCSGVILLGIPGGIWALVVLLNADVRAAFDT